MSSADHLMASWPIVISEAIACWISRTSSSGSAVGGLPLCSSACACSAGQRWACSIRYAPLDTQSRVLNSASGWGMSEPASDL